MPIRYIFHAKIVSMYEETISHYVPDPSGVIDPQTGRVKYNEQREGTGRWFFRIEGGSAIHISNEKPDFSVGDTIQITVEKQHDQAN